VLVIELPGAAYLLTEYLLLLREPESSDQLGGGEFFFIRIATESGRKMGISDSGLGAERARALQISRPSSG